MSPRTYIGPFGRILPLNDGTEPEQLPRPPDESSALTHAPRVELQLPQPELNFGSDTSLGFSDPTRYNTVPRKVPCDASTTVPGQHQVGSDALPPVRHLLPPSIHSERSTKTAVVQKRQPLQQATYAEASDNIVYPSQRRDHTNVPPTAHERLQETSYPSQASAYDPRSNANAALIREPTWSESSAIDCHPQGSLYGRPQSFERHLYTHPKMAPGDRLSRPPPSNGFAPTSECNASFVSQRFRPEGLASFEPNECLPPKSTAMRNNSPKEAKPTPKVIREEFRPEEGAVWLYEDGSVCPKMIDGQVVNANWGITKAGKPRKRLALACTACREKKFRCDAAEPKCAQCEKFGRICKYTTATRRGRKHSGSPSYEMQARHYLADVKLEGSPSPSPIDPSQRRTSCSPPTTPTTIEASSSHIDADLDESQPSLIIKKRRLSSPASYGKSPVVRDLKEKKSTAPIAFDAFEQKLLSVAIGDGKKVGDSSVILHYIDLFFLHIGSLSSKTVSSSTLMRLLGAEADQNNEARTLFHAIIAVGTTFSKTVGNQDAGETFSELSRQACEHLSPQSAVAQQTRLLLALYYSVTGQMTRAWSLAAEILPFTLESARSDEDGKDVKGIG